MERWSGAAWQVGRLPLDGEWLRKKKEGTEKNGAWLGISWWMDGWVAGIEHETLGKEILAYLIFDLCCRDGESIYADDSITP